MRRKHIDRSAASRVDSGPAPNPLERSVDRSQARARATALALVALMIPISVWLATSILSNQEALVVEHSQSRHSVTAVTSSEAITDVGSMQTEFVVHTAAAVDATWTYDGVDHDGQVTVAVGSPIGTEVDIWVDNSGERSMPPVTEADAVAAAVFAGLGSFLAVASLLWGSYAWLRFRFDAYRDAQWDLAIKNFLDENSLS